jgi:hypothetical protein
MTRGVPRTWFLIVLAAFVPILGADAFADQYWVAYEGNDFPESEGRERHVYGGGAERYLQNGVLVLDGRASIAIADFYHQSLPSDPGPGETFQASWSLLVSDVTGYADPAVLVGSHGHGSVLLRYSEDRVYSALEGFHIEFAPGVVHQYLLTSTTMLSYNFYIDGTLACAGSFLGPMGASQVEWGDATQGASSLSQWDFFRFGIVPEPARGLTAGAIGLVCMRGRPRRSQ